MDDGGIHLLPAASIVRLTWLSAPSSTEVARAGQALLDGAVVEHWYKIGYALYNDEWGVYLGASSLWSNKANAGITEAQLFPSPARARKSYKDWVGDKPPRALVVIVEDDMGSLKASMEACIRAGIPAWSGREPRTLREQECAVEGCPVPVGTYEYPGHYHGMDCPECGKRFCLSHWRDAGELGCRCHPEV